MSSVLARRSLVLLNSQQPRLLNSSFNAGLTASSLSQKRALSYVLDGFGGGGSSGSTGRWPVTKNNTIFNIVPQGHKYVIERFGKLHSIQDSGWFLAIPFADQIAYIIDIRERAMDIPPQSAITRDNVSVEVSGNLFVKFQDAQNAAYGALNPLYSVTQVRCEDIGIIIVVLKECNLIYFLCFFHFSTHNLP
jgi:hypothetical protein